MSDQYSNLINTVLKTSKDALTNTRFTLPSGKRAVEYDVFKEYNKLAEKDKKTREWDRYLRDPEGLRRAIQTNIAPLIELRTNKGNFTSQIIDTYINKYKNEEGYVPFYAGDESQLLANNSARLFEKHYYRWLADPEYRNEVSEGVVPEKDRKDWTDPIRGPRANLSSKEFYEWMRGEATESPYFTLLGKKQRELREGRIRSAAKQLGEFKIQPFNSRAEAGKAFTKAIKIEKLKDIELPSSEIGYLDVLEDKWDSQLEYGTLQEIIYNTVTQSDQYARAFPVDPEFDPREHEELDRWAASMNNPRFSERLFNSKSYQEAQAYYLGALDEITKQGRAREYFGEPYFESLGTLGEFATDIGVGIVGDPLGLLLGAAEGKAVATGVSKVIKGYGAKQIATRWAVDGLVGGAEGAYFMNLYANNADPTRQEAETLKGFLVGAGFGAVADLATGTGRELWKSRQLSRQRMFEAQRLQDYDDYFNRAVQGDQLVGVGAGIPPSERPINRQRIEAMLDQDEQAWRSRYGQDVEDELLPEEKLSLIPEERETVPSVDVDQEFDPETANYLKGLIVLGKTTTGSETQTQLTKRYELSPLEATQLIRLRDSFIEAGIDPEVIFTAEQVRPRPLPQDIPGKPGQPAPRISSIQAAFNYLGFNGFAFRRFQLELLSNKNSKLSDRNYDKFSRDSVTNDDLNLMTILGLSAQKNKEKSFLNALARVGLSLDEYSRLLAEGVIRYEGIKGLAHFHNEFKVDPDAKTVISRKYKLAEDLSDIDSGVSRTFSNLDEYNESSTKQDAIPEPVEQNVSFLESEEFEPVSIGPLGSLNQYRDGLRVMGSIHINENLVALEAMRLRAQNPQLTAQEATSAAISRYSRIEEFSSDPKGPFFFKTTFSPFRLNLLARVINEDPLIREFFQKHAPFDIEDIVAEPFGPAFTNRILASLIYDINYKIFTGEIEITPDLKRRVDKIDQELRAETNKQVQTLRDREDLQDFLNGKDPELLDAMERYVTYGKMTDEEVQRLSELNQEFRRAELRFLFTELLLSDYANIKGKYGVAGPALKEARDNIYANMGIQPSQKITANSLIFSPTKEGVLDRFFNFGKENRELLDRYNLARRIKKTLLEKYRLNRKIVGEISRIKEQKNDLYQRMNSRPGGPTNKQKAQMNQLQLKEARLLDSVGARTVKDIIAQSREIKRYLTNQEKALDGAASTQMKKFYAGLPDDFDPSIIYGNIRDLANRLKKQYKAIQRKFESPETKKQRQAEEIGSILDKFTHDIVNDVEALNAVSQLVDFAGENIDINYQGIPRTQLINILNTVRGKDIPKRAAALGSQRGNWDYGGLDSEHNPFLGKNEIYSVDRLRRWIKETNEFLTREAGLDDRTKGVDVNTLSENDLVDLSESLIEDLKRLEAEDVLDILGTGENLTVAGKVAEALNIDPGTRRYNIYRHYAQFIGMSHNMMAPSAFRDIYLKQLAGRSRAIPLSIYIELNPHLSDVDLKNHVLRYHQNIPHFAFLSFRDLNRFGYDELTEEGIIDSLLEGTTFKSALEQNKIVIDYADPETIERFALLTIELETAIAKNDNVVTAGILREVLGPIGSLGLPEKLQQIVVPSSRSTSWRSWFDRIYDSLEELEPNYPYLTQRADELRGELQRRLSDIRSRLEAGEITEEQGLMETAQVMNSELMYKIDDVQEQLSFYDPDGEYFGIAYQRVMEEMKDFFAEYDQFFDQTARDWYTSVVGEPDIAEAKTFLEYHVTELVNTLLIYEKRSLGLDAEGKITADPEKTVRPSPQQVKIRKIINNALLLAGREELFPEQSVDLVRLTGNDLLPLGEDHYGFNRSTLSEVHHELTILTSELNELEARLIDEPDSALIRAERDRLKSEYGDIISLRNEIGNLLNTSDKLTTDIKKLSNREARVAIFDEYDKVATDLEASKSQTLATLANKYNLSDSTIRILSRVLDNSVEDLRQYKKKITDTKFGAEEKVIYLDPERGISNFKASLEAERDVSPEGLKVRRKPRGRKGGGIPIDEWLGLIAKAIKIPFDVLKRLLTKLRTNPGLFDVETATANTIPREPMTAREWASSWGGEVVDNALKATLRKVTNFVRSARGRANASEMSMIRKLGQILFGSELYVDANGHRRSRAAIDSKYEAVQQGVTKYRARVLAQFKKTMDDVRRSRKRKAAAMNISEKEFDERIKTIYAHIRKVVESKLLEVLEQQLQGRVGIPELSSGQLRELTLAVVASDIDTVARILNLPITDVQEIIRTVKLDELVSSIIAQIERSDDLRSNLGDISMKDFNSLLEHFREIERAKETLKELLPEDSEYARALDSKNLTNAMDLDSFRDLEFALDNGEVERIIGDSIDIKGPEAASPDQPRLQIFPNDVQRSILGQVIYKAINAGRKSIVFSAGSYTKDQLRKLMMDNLSIVDLQARFPELQGKSKSDIISEVLEDLFQEAETIEITFNRSRTHTARTRPDLTETAEYRRLSQSSTIGDRLSEDGSQLVDFTLDDIVRADTLDDLEKIGKDVIDDKIERDVLGEINDDLNRSNVVDDDGKPLQFTTLNDFFKFFEDQITEQYKAGNLKQTAEAKKMFEYMKTVLTGRTPSNLDPAASRFVRFFQKAATAMNTAGFGIAAIPELAVAAMRNLPYVISKIPVINDFLTGAAQIKNYSDDVNKQRKKVKKLQKQVDKLPEGEEKLRLTEQLNKERQSLIDLENKQAELEDFMYSAGVGTEGALYRNSGSNRKSIIFDSENPMFSPARRVPDYGKLGLPERVLAGSEDALEEMATAAADGDLVPGLKLVERLFQGITSRYGLKRIESAVSKVGKAVDNFFDDKEGQGRLLTNLIKAFSLNTITEWSQKLVFNSMTSRVLNRIDNLEIDPNFLNKADLTDAELNAKASEIMNLTLAAQLGLSPRDLISLALQVKQSLKDHPDYRTTRRKVKLYDLGSIINDPNIDPQIREKFRVGLYNWIGQNIVRPDAGDLPLYVSNTFVNLLTQFRSFGMAQFSKQIAPVLQRIASGDSKAAVNGLTSLSVIAVMNVAYNLFNHFIYNPEEWKEDYEKYGGFAGMASEYLQQMVRFGEDQRLQKPSNNMGKVVWASIVEPFLGAGNVVKDVSLPTLGIDDPTAWYEKSAYGGKLGFVDDIMRSSAPVRAAGDIVDPLRRAFSGQDAWKMGTWTEKMSGRYKHLKMLDSMKKVLTD